MNTGQRERERKKASLKEVGGGRMEWRELGEKERKGKRGKGGDQ